MTTQFTRGQQSLSKMVRQLSQMDPHRGRRICADLGVFVEQENADALTVDVLEASLAVKKLTAMNPGKARKIIDTFSDAEMADILVAFSQARIARDGAQARDAFDESIAARLGGVAKAVAA